MVEQTRFRDGTGALRVLKRCIMRDALSVPRTIQQIRMRDAGNVLRTVWKYFSVEIDSYIEEKIDSSTTTSAVVTSDGIAGTVSGGTAPYTYAWEKLSGASGISATTPTTAATAFTATCFNGSPKEATYRLKVTDNNGEIIYSETVSVYLEHIDTDAP